MAELSEVQRPRELSKDPVELSLPRERPRRENLTGTFAQLEPLDPARHAGELYEASHHVPEGERIWDYMPYGPFETLESFTDWLEACAGSSDPLFFAIRDLKTGKTCGMASFLRIVPEHGVIEIGHIWFAPVLQKTPAATDAIFIMLRHALDDLGYRRMEWKCDAVNAASRRAATRFGFSYEGVFYQAVVVKGLNRDSAWFSIMDHEWPAIRTSFEQWLAPENFDEAGNQRTSLRELNWA